MKAALITALGVLAAGAPALAQTPSRPYGRISFYTTSSRYDVEGLPAPTTMSEFITTVTFRSPDDKTNGLDYGLDLRHAGYAAEGRSPRVSIYDGWVGGQFRDGTVRARVGQMWLTDLGALGSVAGGLVELHRTSDPDGGTRLRVGVFGGLEPRVYEFGYAPNVRKLGGYVAYDGKGARRHVAGYVNVRNQSLTERSVLTFTNYVPVRGRFFLYQAAEYDLAGPGGMGNGGLTYFFANARVTLASRLELQGIYNRGRSIDTRGIVEAQLGGRPVTTSKIDGLLYESAGGRVYVEVLRGVRVQAGYSRDKTNRADAASNRLNVGVHITNLAGTGFDVTATDSRINRPSGRYDSIYVSVGHDAGRRVYLSGDFSSALSVIRATGGVDPIRVDPRPRLNRFSGSAVVTVGRTTSVLVTAERTSDQTMSEFRVLAGISYRLR
jgi:hypothetical protein